MTDHTGWRRPAGVRLRYVHLASDHLRVLYAALPDPGKRAVQALYRRGTKLPGWMHPPGALCTYLCCFVHLLSADLRLAWLRLFASRA